MIKLRDFKKEDSNDLGNLLMQLSDIKIGVDVEELESDPNFVGIIAEDDGKIIGFGSISFFQSLIKKKTGVIEDVVVDESCRGKGVGRKITQELIKRAQESGAKLITLTSNPARIPAHKLYESEGFQKRDTGFYVKYL